jgi:hypothetical protein
MPSRFATSTFLLACVFASPLRAQDTAKQPPQDALASTLSQLLRDEIPLAYDKQDDWGATKEITLGYRAEGKPFHLHVHRRKKAVEHGVWKHYKLRMIEPEKNLVVKTDLQPLAGGRAGFTVTLDARLDAWAQAKVYQYGVHLIALTLEGDLRVRVIVEGDVGLRVQTTGGAPGVAVDPVIRNARIEIDELNVRRVSSAHGPVVKQLGDGMRRYVESELNGPRLTEKLNRSIDKKRDRLVFNPLDPQ